MATVLRSAGVDKENSKAKRQQYLPYHIQGEEALQPKYNHLHTNKLFERVDKLQMKLEIIGTTAGSINESRC